MNADIIILLNDIIKSRKEEPAENSYTCSLLSGGENKIIKKLGEEQAEFIRALLVQGEKEITEEAADYIYHMIVALRYKDIDFTKVLAELERRHMLQNR